MYTGLWFRLSQNFNFFHIHFSILREKLILYVTICMRGTPRNQNFEILTWKSYFKYKKAEEKCYQICSMVKFVEHNWTK
jgi:hypothetical protein